MVTPRHCFKTLKEYMEMMQKFFTTTGAAGNHTDVCANCGSCINEKAMMVLIGGKEMDKLFKHTGLVVEEDDMEIIVNRVKHGYMPDPVTISVLNISIKEDPVLSKVGQDVQKGRLRDELTRTN